MLEDMSDAVLTLSGGATFAVTRLGPAVVVGGRLEEPSTSSTFTVAGVLAPLSGRERERLPEGQRERATWQLFTPTQLRTASGTETLADLVTVDGDAYEVAQVDEWAGLGGFYRAVLVKVPT